MVDTLTQPDSGVMPSASAQTLATRRRVAEALLKQGTDVSPVGHWAQGLGRVAQALVGGWLGGSAEQEERARDQQLSGVVQALLGPQAPPTTTPPPSTTPTPTTRAPSGPPGSFPDFVMGQEGFSPRAYGDFRQTSIGYGTRAQPGETSISEPDARMRMYRELGAARDQVRALGVQMTPGQEDALTDLTFNAGAGWMNQSLGAAVRRGDWNEATRLFQQYINAGGQPLEALRRRRGGASPWLTGPGIDGGLDPAMTQPPLPGVTPTPGTSTAGAGAPQTPPTAGAGGPQTPPTAGAGPQVPPAIGGPQISPQARAAIAAVAATNPTAALQMVLPLVTRVDQPTERQRDYAAYVRDQIARNQPYQSFNDWDLANRRATATAITSVQSGENRQSQEEGKQRAEFAGSIRTAGDQAYTMLGRIGIARRALDTPGVYTGPGAENVVLPLRQLVVSLGGSPENAAAVRDMESFRAQANQLVLSAIGGSLSSGFSNADRDFIQRTVPGLGNTPAGNRQLLDIMEAMARRQIEVAGVMDEYAAAHGGQIDAGFYAHLRRWRDAHPMFGGQPGGGGPVGGGGQTPGGGVTRRYNPETGQLE